MIEVLGVSLGCLNTGRVRGNPSWKSRVGAQEEGAWPGAPLTPSSLCASTLSLFGLPLDPLAAPARPRGRGATIPGGPPAPSEQGWVTSRRTWG